MLKINEVICTGCKACEQKCPVSAIKMENDSEGFWQSVIDENLCIACHLCESVCPELVGPVRYEPKKIYGVRYAKDRTSLSRSSSGAAFYAFAEVIIKQNGIVYGAAYEKGLQVKQIPVTQREDLRRIQGSKYVQSDVGKTYGKVQQDLTSGKTVLYSGTPCQIAGLKQFLNQEYENLITVSFICHGVPSPVLFAGYIKWLEKKLGEPVLRFDFRNKKKHGWGFQAVAVTKKKSYDINYHFDPYYHAFLRGNTYRKCCYQCPYATIKRCEDITLGDFWGVEKVFPDFYSKEGVSVVLINNSKARGLFDKIRGVVEYRETDLISILKYNRNLKEPMKRPACRNEIYKNLFENTDKVFTQDLKVKMGSKDIMAAFLPIGIKRVLKKFL